jgi:hypothetical protein
VVLLQWVDDPDSPELTSDGKERSSREIGSDAESFSTASSSPGWTKKLRKVDVFHSYVRPTWRPVLSDFCVQLTGITQVRTVLSSSQASLNCWEEGRSSNVESPHFSGATQDGISFA